MILPESTIPMVAHGDFSLHYFTYICEFTFYHKKMLFLFMIYQYEYMYSYIIERVRSHYRIYFDAQVIPALER